MSTPQTRPDPSIEEVAQAVRIQANLVQQEELVASLCEACHHTPEASFVHASCSYEYDDTGGYYLSMAMPEVLRADGSPIEDPLAADGERDLTDVLYEEIMHLYSAQDICEWYSHDGDETEARIPLSQTVPEASFVVGAIEERDGRRWVTVAVPLPLLLGTGNV